VHNDDEVVPWYDGWKPSLDEAEQTARFMADCWRELGVHKWMAYDRDRGELVGRGGLSRTPADDDWSRIHAFLPPEPWAREVLAVSRGVPVHANWLEIGWALRRQFWGHGFASEIGRAGLDFAFDVLDVRAVVSCTVRHNLRSRAVMEAIGMPYAGMLDGLDGGDDLAVHVLLRSES
jgi:RimJ/RimL family protein N-acetyltransferase